MLTPPAGCGAKSVAFPDNATVCALFVASSMIDSVPDCTPDAFGTNVTEIEQLPPGTNAEGQVLVTE